MRRATLLLLAIGCLTASAQAQQPTLAEGKAQFARADRELNDAWAEAKKRLPEARFNDLIGIQRQWVVFREERAGVAGSAGQPRNANPQNSPAYHTAAARLSEERAAWLRRLAKGEEEPLTGLWIDAQGGTVQVVEQAGRILFDFNVVRGKTYDLGVLAGMAAWNESIGWFSDKGRDKQKTDETNIAFIRRDLHLEIIAANARYYLGKRAYFDGNYFKAASLDAQEQAAVVRAGESGKSAAEQ